MVTVPDAARPVAATQPGFWRLNGINLFWLASQGLWNAIYVLLAISATVAAPDRKVLVVGQATAAGGVLAAFVPILTGWMSDRTTGRWGRRSPWILGGAVINILGLVLLAWAPNAWALVAAYLVLQLGNNAALGAFAGIIPDLIPEDRRGGASGLLNSASILGTLVCLGLVLLVLSRLGSTAIGAASGYLVIAALLAVCTVVSLAVLHEAPHMAPSRPRAALTADAVVRGVRDALAPLRDRDFFWVLATRIFQTLGIWTILPFVPFYFQEVVTAPNYGAASDLWLLAVLAGGLPLAIACGYISDRVRRRKVFVYLSSGLQALVAGVLVFTLISDLPLIYSLGLIFGLGYGAYSSVDWALACDVLPDQQGSAGKDMGLFHASLTLPQVFAPALLAPILYFLNRSGHSLVGVHTGGNLGFRIVFASAAIWFVLATVMVTRIRGVR